MLARQLLLERAALPLPAALEQVAGLQAQYAPAMYVGLWSRLREFARDHLTRALEQRSVVQGTVLRATIHLVSAADYWPFALAVRQERRTRWLRVPSHRVHADEVAAAAERLRHRLADGPVRRPDLEALVGRGLVLGLGLWLDLLRVPPSGTWERRRADLYADAERWLGPPGVEPDAAVELVVRRYLGGFGPAPLRDVADWAGLPVTVVGQAVARMEARRFRDERGGELVDLPEAPLPPPDILAPVRFLPVWDATLLVHARRAGVLPEEHRSRVFTTKTPQSVATFLVDGKVAGRWTYDRGAVRVDPFHPLARSTRREVEREAEALGAFHA
ncbi:MAG TPA: winged helix DNA-binding domain-containing protein [Mycobacteriales bacterium]|nr:winged helix DNA-binding domain-containing protein [Mycobacteriales bacterium]